jgi:hypothetical protein
VTNKDFAVENSARFTIKDSLIELVAGAMRLLVVDDRMRVCVLCSAHDVKPVHPTFRAFVSHPHCNVMARKLSTEVNGCGVVTAV